MRKCSICHSVVTAFVLALLALSMVGCGAGTGESSAEITFTDDAGEKFMLEEPATRVVSLAPANTEILYAIGAEDKLVGVTTYCDYPAEAKEKAKVGDFSTPNVEKIASLDPQVVFATSGVQETTVQNLEKLGIEVFVIDPATLDRLFTDMRNVGKVVGLEDQAGEVVADLEARVREVTTTVEDAGEPKVFFEIYNQPLMTAGSGTLIDDLIRTAKATNIGAAAGPQFPQFSEEQLITDSPEVYFATKDSMSKPEDIAARPGYSEIAAVKAGRIHVVDGDLFSRPGPRSIDGLELLAKYIHPDEFNGQ